MAQGCGGLPGQGSLCSAQCSCWGHMGQLGGGPSSAAGTWEGCMSAKPPLVRLCPLPHEGSKSLPLRHCQFCLDTLAVHSARVAVPAVVLRSCPGVLQPWAWCLLFAGMCQCPAGSKCAQCPSCGVGQPSPRVLQPQMPSVTSSGSPMGPCWRFLSRRVRGLFRGRWFCWTEAPSPVPAGWLLAGWGFVAPRSIMRDSVGF